MFELPGSSRDTSVCIDLESSPVVVSPIKIATLTASPECKKPITLLLKVPLILSHALYK